MATEKRLIDANGLMEEINKQRRASMGSFPKRHYVVGDVLNSILNAPTVDAVEVVHGRWLFITKGQQTTAWCCSECNRVVAITCDEDLRQERLKKEYPFCHCGAKMDGGADHGL